MVGSGRDNTCHLLANVHAGWATSEDAEVVVPVRGDYHYGCDGFHGKARYKKAASTQASSLASPLPYPAQPSATLVTPLPYPAQPSATLVTPLPYPAQPSATLVTPLPYPAQPSATLVTPLPYPAQPSATLVTPLLQKEGR
ncbi:hypothetical protein O3P69_015263 [Scylla paramamosain]|uniref:Uncharacterized protein n=1 Tax=Scylla paramamosain TaxID=85552 RepID=A0AAW0T3G7_SCYPA